MKHIYQRGDSWYYQFTVQRRRYQGAIGTVSKAVAREVAEKKRGEALESGLVKRPLKTPLLGQYDAETGTFTGAAGDYLAYYVKQHKPSSAVRMHTALKSLCPFFGGKRLGEIHAFMIERYKSTRKEAGAADATVNRELACLKNLFNLGIKWGWVRENPVREVKMFRENNSRLRWLAPAEESALLAECDDRLRMFVLAALDTGFRAGELQSLRWQEVDSARGNIAVRSGYTKNGDARTNPMTRRLAEALAKWKQQTGGAGDAFVFGPWRYREPFETARSNAKLSEDLVFHSLRHTYISRLVSAGANIREVQELAGHKTITMTMRYSHLAPEHKRRAVGLLESEIGVEVTAKVTTGDFSGKAQAVASAVM
jgi:integrase